MIPEFDENGNLPPGIHEATFDEVLERFSKPKTARRKGRTRTLHSFYAFIKRFATAIYIDGSYTTNKPAPNDVDIIVLLRGDFRFNSPPGKRLEWFRYNKENRRHLHIFPIHEGDNDRFTFYLNFFQTTRDLNRKGIISVRIEND